MQNLVLAAARHDPYNVRPKSACVAEMGLQGYGSSNNFTAVTFSPQSLVD